jgi:hypothetical protein
MPRSANTNRTLRCVKLFYFTGISMFINIIIGNQNTRKHQLFYLILRVVIGHPSRWHRVAARAHPPPLPVTSFSQSAAPASSARTSVSPHRAHSVSFMERLVFFRELSVSLREYSVWPHGTGFPQLPSAVTSTADHPRPGLLLY